MFTFSTTKACSEATRGMYHFYFWEIYFELEDDIFLILVLYGSREKPFPHILRLESSDNYHPYYKETSRKTISPEGLRLLFASQLEKMGFQLKSYGGGMGVGS